MSDSTPNPSTGGQVPGTSTNTSSDPGGEVPGTSPDTPSEPGGQVPGTSPPDLRIAARRKAVIESTTISAAVLIALALYGMVNYLSMRHYTRFDWTSAQLYTLSEKSKNVVSGLEQDIDLIVLLHPETPVFAATDELLDRYVAANPQRLRRRDLDPARDQLELQQLIDRYSIARDNVLIVASDTDQRVIGEFDLATLDYSGAQVGQPTTISEFHGEQQITSAILSLVEGKKPKVVVTTGHGEAPFDPASADETRPLGQAYEVLGKDNFDLDTWSSLGAETVPEDTDLLVIAAPTSRFLPPELELLSGYLERGGRLLVFLDPVFGPDSEQLIDLGLEDWLRQYGVEVGEDIVLDPDNAVPFYGAETFFTQDFGSHPVVEGLEQTGTPVIWLLARSVGIDALSSVEGVALASTSEGGWAELTPSQPPVEPSEGELRGPVSVAVAVELPVEGSSDEARMVVFGDLDFATDLQLSSGGNAVLLLNAFNWLVDREHLIEIEPRRPEKTRLSMEQDELLFIYIFALLLLPGFAVTAGVWMALRRRR